MSTSGPRPSIDTTDMVTMHRKLYPSASGTASAPSALELCPKIDVSISASHPTLDLASRTRFSLTITFTLQNSSQPIALFTASSPLLQLLTALTSSGLAFINSRTGAPVPQPILHISGHAECTLGQSPHRNSNDNDNGPPYSNSKPITYLQPGVPWSITHTLGPDVRRPQRVWVGLDGLPERDEGPEEAFWFGTKALQDGNVYNVSLSDEAGRGVKVFEREGAAWEVVTAPVRMAAALGLVAEGFKWYGEGRWALKEEMPMELVQTAEFEFRGVPEGMDGVSQWE